MARAAKVPKVAKRFKLGGKYRIQDISEFHGAAVAITDSGKRIKCWALPGSDADRMKLALNILEAIERGELIVKEAE